MKIQQSDLLFGQSRCAVQTRKADSPGRLVPCGAGEGSRFHLLCPQAVEWPGRLSILPAWGSTFPHKLSITWAQETPTVGQDHAV